MTDFYSLLNEKIRAIRANPEQTRQLIYDLARYALRNKVYTADSSLTAAEVGKQLTALERAIAQIEAEARRPPAKSAQQAKAAHKQAAEPERMAPEHEETAESAQLAEDREKASPPVQPIEKTEDAVAAEHTAADSENAPLTETNAGSPKIDEPAESPAVHEADGRPPQAEQPAQRMDASTEDEKKIDQPAAPPPQPQATATLASMEEDAAPAPSPRERYEPWEEPDQPAGEENKDSIFSPRGPREEYDDPDEHEQWNDGTDRYEEVPHQPRRRDRAHNQVVVVQPRQLRRLDPYDDEEDERFRSLRGDRSVRVPSEALALLQILAEERRSPKRRILSWFDGALRAFVAIAVLFAIYAFWPARSFTPAADPPAPSGITTNAGTVPIPASYGVYAVHDKRLFGLETARTSPVDPRTRHLLQMTDPSRTVFPDGRLSFVIYRRDIATTAPVSVPVRIAARIASMMRYGSEGALITVRPDADTWLIYTAGYDFRVQPIPENPETILVRPEDPDFVLPAGRYVLLLNDQPYDFTVDGKITDPRSCVEGFTSPRGPVFHACKTASQN